MFAFVWSPGNFKVFDSCWHFFGFQRLFKAPVGALETQHCSDNVLQSVPVLEFKNPYELCGSSLKLEQIYPGFLGFICGLVQMLACVICLCSASFFVDLFVMPRILEHSSQTQNAIEFTSCIVQEHYLRSLDLRREVAGRHRH